MRPRKRRGPNPKYWWIWAIVIVLLILLANNTIPKLARENAEKEAAEKADTAAYVWQIDEGASPCGGRIAL
ncbi:MAG: hypothetical protein IKD89_05075 [Clostridia bacterium]|nr:hypothetical protein [Clostridia bacterium]